MFDVNHCSLFYKFNCPIEFTVSLFEQFAIHCNVLQDMKGCMELALKADAAGGAASGLQNLEAAVSLHSDGLLEDAAKLSTQEKLKTWVPALATWVRGETSNPLRHTSPLSVAQHAAFGKIKAKIIYDSCTCSTLNGTTAPGPDASACSLHAKAVTLPDIVWQVTRQVHEVFGDQFMALANLLAQETTAGRLSVVC